MEDQSDKTAFDLHAEAFLDEVKQNLGKQHP